MKAYTVEHLAVVDSTNNYLKKKAELGAPSFSCVVANKQTAGKGRMGRNFISPAEDGLYMSLLLRPCADLKGASVSDAALITACAAVAVREAIKAVTGKQTDIKWVNDLYYEGKKVCGILAEGVYSQNTKSFDYIVLGIGINLRGNFKGTELEKIATSLYGDSVPSQNLKNELLHAILTSFINRYTLQVPNGGHDFFDEYKNGLFVLGKDVEVLQGNSTKNAKIIDLNHDFTLKIRYDNGSEAALNSGEVKLKIK